MTDLSAAEILLPEWFTPTDDDDNAIKSSFRVRCLNGMEYLELMSLGEVVGDNFVTEHAGKEFLVRHGLVDWKGVDDISSGVTVLFSLAAINDHLAANTILAISNKVFQKASLGEAERKNLVSQLKSSSTPSDSTVSDASGDGTVTQETPPQ